MNVRKYCRTVAAALMLLSCKNNKPGYKYSATETTHFLEEIVKNAKASITDFTESQKEPADQFVILTQYPLDSAELAVYKAKGYLENRTDDIADFAVCTVKDYDLVNEINEKLAVTGNGRASTLQASSLWEHNGVLCHNAYVEINLDKKYEKLRGYITIEFAMPGNVFGKEKRELRVPVNITIHDRS